jgi:hypothetical protein
MAACKSALDAGLVMNVVFEKYHRERKYRSWGENELKKAVSKVYSLGLLSGKPG